MKRTFRKFPRKPRFGAPLARRRRTWQQFAIDPCDPVVLEHCSPTDGCCTDIARLELLGNQQLQDLFSDRCSVVRTLGDIWFVQNMGTIQTIDDIAAWTQWLNASQEFIGLRRGEITSQAPQLPSLDIWDPAFDDLSEGQWFKTWQRFSSPADHLEVMQGNNDSSGFNLSLPVGTDDTHTFIVPGTTACNPFATGTGDICVETTHDTDCVDCGQALTSGQILFSSVTGRLLRTWHVHLDVKKRVSLRENQGFYLVYNLRHYGAGQPAAADSFSTIFGNVRTLIEMG